MKEQIDRKWLYYTGAGLYAGLLLALIEAVDRAVIFSSFTASIFQRLHLCVNLAFLVAGSTLLGGAVGLLCWTARSVWRVLSGRLNKEWLRVPISALVMTLLVRFLLLLFPAVPKSFDRLLENIHNKVLHVGPLLKLSPLLFIIGLFTAFLIVAWIDTEHFDSLVSRRWLMLSLLLTLPCITFAFYWIDARASVGRYLYLFHFPAALLATFFSMLCGTIISHVLRARPVVTVTLAAIVLCLTIFAAARFNSDQVVKAFFWRRGVVAKKYVDLAQKLADLDGDGFSVFLGGGDCDDRRKDVHPLAQDLPGDGLDANCNGIEGGEAQEFSNLNRSPLPENPAQNAIFITIDCLRADHLGVYGYSRATSPRLDDFASRAMVFERAFSTGTNTGHTFSSIARASYGEGIFDEKLPTIAQVFASQGRLTAAITSPRTKKWLNKEDWQTYKEIMMAGLERLVHEKEGYWNSQKLTDKSIEFLEQNGSKPFYLWIHYNDLHAKSERYVAQRDTSFGSAAVDIYDANLKFTDEHLGRLLDYLTSSGLIDKTAIIISADHGEEFGEHGQKFHNGRPSRIQTHVPMIFWYPGVKPQRISQPVTSADIGPTLLRATAITPPADYTGVDLRLIAERKAEGRVVVSESPRNVPDPDFFAWSLVDGEWRLIYDCIGGTWELYDDLADPMGRTNLIESRADVAARLKMKFATWMDKESRRANFKNWVRF